MRHGEYHQKYPNPITADIFGGMYTFGSQAGVFIDALTPSSKSTYDSSHH